jgi:hypothetical protein
MAAMLHRLTILVLFDSALASDMPAQPPVHAHADLIAVHDYRWRGIPRATGWNLQVEGLARVGETNVWSELSVWYDPFERRAAYLETGLTAPVLALHPIISTGYRRPERR